MKTMLMLAMVALVASAGRANAQSGTEVGVALGGMTTSGHPTGLEASISTGLTDQWSTEGFVSIFHDQTFLRGVGGEYGFVFKRYWRPDGVPFQPLMGVGLLGWYERRTIDRGAILLDGAPPSLPVIGGGVRVGLSSRFAVEARADAVLLFGESGSAIRTTASLAIRIGRD